VCEILGRGAVNANFQISSFIPLETKQAGFWPAVFQKVFLRSLLYFGEIGPVCRHRRRSRGRGEQAPNDGVGGSTMHSGPPNSDISTSTHQPTFTGIHSTY